MSTRQQGPAVESLEPVDGLPSRPLRALADAVLATFTDDDWDALAADAGTTVERLAAARAAFVGAGLDALRAEPSPASWVQLSLEIAPGGWEPLVAGDAVDRLERWVQADPRRRFTFIRKPPGLRVRMLGLDEGGLEAAERALDKLVERRALASWTRGPYDAELFQFGGPAGLDLTHRFFTIESLAALAYLRVALAGDARLSRDQFSLILVDRMLGQATGDAWEAWDVWCKMRLAGRLVVDPSAPSVATANEANARRLRSLLANQERRIADASPAEREIFQRYDRRLLDLGELLRAVQRDGSLLWGLREILPFWIVFHWNRMGVPFERQRTLATAMVTALSPKREHR